MIEQGCYAADVRRLGWWYQDFELPDGTRTGNGEEPCYRPELRWNLLSPFVPESLDGATVLDVGGNAGYFSMQLSKRGAKHCVIVEPFEEFAAQAEFVGKACGASFEIVVEDIHSYVLTTDRKFDVIVFLGCFYHLRYPTLVLDRLAQMTGSLMLFHSAIMDDKALSTPLRAAGSAEREAIPIDPVTGVVPTMTFLETSFRGDPTNWWLPTPAAIYSLLRCAGHEVVSRPHDELFVTKPLVDLGTYKKGSLVLSNYRKNNAPNLVYPGPQKVHPELWAKLIAQRWGGE